MVTSYLQASFSGGEVSPALYARVDSASYASWLKTACNFYVHPQGGASNRQGTAFMGQAKYENKPCRLIPFVLGEADSYVIELGDKYLRIFTSSGLLKKDGAVFELSTPYGAYELASVSYTQYAQTLFLAHPAYPPKRLTRQENGYFILEDLPLSCGPFMSFNTDSSRKLRLIKNNDTVVSEGVPARLSFQPKAYSHLFVQGYFNGTLFYSGMDYGLNLDLLVSEFNVGIGGGFKAYNDGGIMRIESPSDTGGDCNGMELIFLYRYSFYRDPELTVVQTLKGGSNKGEVINAGEDKFLLESNFDLFLPSHTDGRFCISQRLAPQEKSATMAYQDISDTIKSGGDWKLSTTGTWTGNFVLEFSKDAGNTWQEARSFSRSSGEENLSAFGNLEDSSDMYLLRLRGTDISGEMGFILQSEAFVQQGVAVVEKYISSRQVSVRIEQQFASEDFCENWAEGAFSPSAGYPSCVFVYQDRLGFAGTFKEPQTLWFSKTSSYYDFGHARGDLLDSDSFGVKLSGKSLNPIYSVIVSNKLLIFTGGSEWTLVATGGILTPYNIQVSQQSERGASRTRPFLVGNRTLYVQARGGVLRDFYYDYSSDSYTGNDLTILSKHLFFNKQIKEMAYQQEPDNLIWCILSDGTALTLTYVAEQNICAWTRHETKGNFKSVCVAASHGYDEVWFAVERNGKYFIERLVKRLSSKAPEDQIFLDACVSRKSEEMFTEVSGLEHLQGLEGICLLADGNWIADIDITDGKITLPSACKCVHIGLGYSAELATLPIYLAQLSLPYSRKYRTVSAMIKLLDSRGGRVGAEGQSFKEMGSASVEKMDIPRPLQTEDCEISLQADHRYFPSIIFRQPYPLPVTLLAVQVCLA